MLRRSQWSTVLSRRPSLIDADKSACVASDEKNLIQFVPRSSSLFAQFAPPTTARTNHTAASCCTNVSTDRPRVDQDPTEIVGPRNNSRNNRRDVLREIPLLLQQPLQRFLEAASGNILFDQRAELRRWRSGYKRRSRSDDANFSSKRTPLQFSYVVISRF